MELGPDRLRSVLAAEPLRPVYLVAGAEPLLVGEAADAIRARAREQGFDERVVHEADKDFDWDLLAADFGALSLFSRRRLFDVRLPTGKPGVAGAKFLGEYCAAPPPDTVLLIVGADWSRAHAGKWSQTIAECGHLVPCWPLKPAELPAWLGARLARAGLRAEPEALALLAERTEGNLLAAAQEIDKLGLVLAPGTRLDAEALRAQIADFARFDVFALFEAALAGDAPRVLRVLAGLHAEGAQVPALLGWVGRQLLLLARLASVAEAGGDLGAEMRQAGVWAARQTAYQGALRRQPAWLWERFVAEAARVDQAAKGRLDRDPWQLLERLLLAVSQPRHARALLTC